MKDKQDILKRMASQKELANLKLGKDKPLAAILRDRMGMVGDVAENMTPESELSKRMKLAQVLPMADEAADVGSKMVNPKQLKALSLMKKAKGIGSKVFGKGLGRAASMAAGPLGMLISEGADAADLGPEEGSRDAAMESGELDEFNRKQDLEKMMKENLERKDKVKEKVMSPEYLDDNKYVREISDDTAVGDREFERRSKEAEVRQRRMDILSGRKLR